MHKELIERNPVLKHSIDLALMVIDFCELLQEQKTIGDLEPAIEKWNVYWCEHYGSAEF